MGKHALTPAFRFLKATYGRHLTRRYKLSASGIDAVLPIEGPALVLANHTHTLDPFLISAVYPYTIRWVAGSYLFKMKAVGFLLRHLVGSIAKVQGRSDLGTIRSIGNALKKGDIVGLFPEGTRSWDGEMMDITKATAKLLRLFKVPVVFVHIEGGFLNKPRWSDVERKGPIHVSVVRVLDSGEISSMSLGELSQVTKDCLSFSTDDWQERARIPYEGAHMAEGSERLFYLCPECHSFSTMHGQGRRVSCSHCGFHADFDDYGFIHTDCQVVDWRHLRDWHHWETAELGRRLNAQGGGAPLFADHGILFQIPGRKRLLTVSKDFEVSVGREGFHFHFSRPFKYEGSSVSSYTFPFSSIESVIVNAKQTIEFFADGRQYRFRTALDRSALKYQEAYAEAVELGLACREGSQGGPVTPAGAV